MNLFTRLRELAQTCPELPAVDSSTRAMTYRKLWSRIERATARLQSEWNIGSGHRLLYAGNAHPDAIVLVIAAMRSGAELVTVENAGLHGQLDNIARELQVTALVHDDDMPALHLSDPDIRLYRLSSLIESRCPHQPVSVREDPHHATLVTVLAEAGGLRTQRISLVRLQEAAVQAGHSAAGSAGVPGPAVIGDTLFAREIFGPVALAALFAGATLRMR